MGTKATKLKRHPWDAWFARKRFVLVRGKDYFCMSHSMAQSIWNKAALPKYRLQVRVLIKENPDRIEVQVLGARRMKCRA